MTLLVDGFEEHTRPLARTQKGQKMDLMLVHLNIFVVYLTKFSYWVSVLTLATKRVVQVITESTETNSSKSN